MQWAVQVAADAHVAVDKNMKLLAKVTAWKKTLCLIYHLSALSHLRVFPARNSGRSECQARNPCSLGSTEGLEQQEETSLNNQL